MAKEHVYNIKTVWTGNTGFGTKDYKQYKRDHVISVQHKPELLLSADPSFRGDPNRYNPEELLVASLSSCHMLWYLHLCANAGIFVAEYADDASGVMMENNNGSGKFLSVTLHPEVHICDILQKEKAELLHTEASRYCFIAASVNFPVYYKPVIKMI